MAFVLLVDDIEEQLISQTAVQQIIHSDKLADHVFRDLVQAISGVCVGRSRSWQRDAMQPHLQGLHLTSLIQQLTDRHFHTKQEFGFTHLSAGDLLRAERNTEGSQYGELIEEHIRNGTIVPVEITCKLLENAMKACQVNGSGDANGRLSSSGKFLIDGFPRNRNNLEGWQKEMHDKVDLKFVLFFDCPRDICVERCIKRGEAGSGRSDDNVESLHKRINTYLNDTMPIIDHYHRLNLVRKVDAARPPDQVFRSVADLFQQIDQ